MSRRLCIVCLTVFLSTPAVPIFASDSDWQLPETSQWIAQLADWIGERFQAEKNEGGAAEGGESMEDENPQPDPEHGPYMDPNG